MILNLGYIWNDKMYRISGANGWLTKTGGFSTFDHEAMSFPTEVDADLFARDFGHVVGKNNFAELSRVPIQVAVRYLQWFMHQPGCDVRKWIIKDGNFGAVVTVDAYIRFTQDDWLYDHTSGVYFCSRCGFLPGNLADMQRHPADRMRHVIGDFVIKPEGNTPRTDCVILLTPYRPAAWEKDLQVPYAMLMTSFEEEG